VLAARARYWACNPPGKVFPLSGEDVTSLVTLLSPRGTAPKGLWIGSASCQSYVPSDRRLLTSEVMFVGLAGDPLPLGYNEEAPLYDESYLA